MCKILFVSANWLTKIKRNLTIHDDGSNKNKTDIKSIEELD